MRNRTTLLALPLLLLLAVTGGDAQEAGESPDERLLPVPETDIGENLLDARRRAQLRAAEGWAVRHDFSFEDRREESGIAFRHRATEDGTRHYKMVHYDHGNGVSAADVDGDGLFDLYFVTQLGGNELWRNLGDGRFEEITGRAGVAVADRVSVAASFADADDDGDPDLFVTTVKMGNLLFENLGGGRFRDVTEAAGVGHVGHSSGALFFDYDLDGRLDLLVTNVGRYTTDDTGPGGYYVGVADAFQGHLHADRTETSILYRNLGDLRFEDVTEATGLVDGSWSGDAVFTDLTGDRFPDVYLPNMQGDDHYWENRPADGGGRRFVERRAEVFPRSPWGTMGADFLDWNDDGLPDLILTDMHSDMSQEVPPYVEKMKSEMTWSETYLEGSDDNIFGNAFWENRGEEGMVEISDLVGAENYWPWGVSVADLNADGWLDVFVASSMSYPWRYGINTVLLNDRGQRFLDAEFVLGVEPRAGGTKVEYFQLDCSGADAEHERCEGREGVWTVLGTLGTRSAVVFDLDRDGDLDVVTSEFHARPQVLVSDLAAREPAPRWLEIELRGTESNRDGLGAEVAVHAGDRVIHRVHDGKSGYLSQSSLPLWVGLGEAGSVEKVVVRWPSGREQTVSEGIEIGSRLEIVEEERSAPTTR